MEITKNVALVERSADGNHITVWSVNCALMQCLMFYKISKTYMMIDEVKEKCAAIASAC